MVRHFGEHAEVLESGSRMYNGMEKGIWPLGILAARDRSVALTRRYRFSFPRSYACRWLPSHPKPGSGSYRNWARRTGYTRDNAGAAHCQALGRTHFGDHVYGAASATNCETWIAKTERTKPSLTNSLTKT